MDKFESQAPDVEQVDVENMIDDCECQNGQHGSPHVSDEQDALTNSPGGIPNGDLQPNDYAKDMEKELENQTKCEEIVFCPNAVSSEESPLDEINDEIEPSDIISNHNSLIEESSESTEEIENPVKIVEKEVDQLVNNGVFQTGDYQTCEEDMNLDSSKFADADKTEPDLKSESSEPRVFQCINDNTNHSEELHEISVPSRNGKLKEMIFSKPDSETVVHDSSLSEDVLPPVGLAKRLVDKWSNISVESQPLSQKPSVIEEFHYAPNTAKSIAAKFSSGNFHSKSSATSGDELSKRACSNGTPISRDLSGKGDQDEVELPAEGITRGLIAKFSSMEA